MGPQPVMRTELHRHFFREIVFDPTLYVKRRKFFQLGLGLLLQLFLLPPDVRLLRIAL